MQRGRSFVEQGQLQEAVRVCRLGLLASPNDIEGRLVLGAALLALSRLDEVLAEVGSALALSPNNPSALALKGDALLQKGDAQQAIKVLDKAAAASPGDPYVENLRVAANAAIASGFKPSETIDIAPDLIPSLNPALEMPAEFITGSAIEIIDEAEFDEATRVESSASPLTLPIDGAIEQPFADNHGVGQFTSDALPMVVPAVLPTQDPSPAAPVLPLPGHVPVASAPVVPAPVAPVARNPVAQNTVARNTVARNTVARNPVAQNPVLARPVGNRLETIGTLFPDDDEPETISIPAGGRPETIGTLFPENEVSTSLPPSGRPATIGTLFPDNEVAASLPPTGRPETIGTLFPEEESDAGRSGETGRPATIGTLFPDTPMPMRSPTVGDLVASETAARPAIRPRTAENMESRARSSDMDLIRGAVEENESLMPGQPARPKPRSNQEAPEQAQTSTSFPMIGWLAMALLVSAGGAWGGLQIRKFKLDRDIQSVQRAADTYESANDYLGFRKARDLYARVASASPSDQTRSTLARSQALLAAEFGEAPEPAAATLAQVGDTSLVDAQIATLYLDIAAGKSGSLLSAAESLSTANPSLPTAHYLLGLGHLLKGSGKAAAVAIEKAIELGPEPLFFVALARAQALEGRYPEALATIARASSTGQDELPSAVIWQSQILLESGNLPENPVDPDDKLADLSTAARASELVAVSRVQGAWAGLVLAKIKLERGDGPAAKKALAEAKVGRPSDWQFSEMLLEVLLESGDLAAAKAEAVSAEKQWPDRMTPHVVSADVSLRQGNPDAAMALLLELEEIDGSAAALTVRGRVFLAQGEIERAVADLDKALAMQAQFVPAGVARAKVDLLRGDARAAISRLEPMYGNSASSALVVAYADALRVSGSLTKARDILRERSERAPSASLLVGLAEVERSAGNLETAAAVYQEAIDLAPRSEDARLGAALLEIDQGRIQAGRDIIEAIVRDGAESGIVFVECARVRIMTGDLDGANELLLRPESSAGWLNWRVARARGRMLIHRQNPVEAVSELQRAQSLRPEDIETRVLLMEAYFEFRNERGSGRALQEITKSFRRAPVRQLASGIHFLLQENSPNALESLHESLALMKKQKASSLSQSRVAYWLGRAYYNSDDMKRAEEWLSKAATQNSAYSSAFYWLGQVQHLEKKTAAMVKSYEKAAEINPSRNPLAWYFLGIHYAEVGNKESAIRTLESFLRYYPEESGDVVVEAKTLLAQVR